MTMTEHEARTGDKTMHGEIREGSLWRLKRDHAKVAQVFLVGDQYVRITMPWTQSGYGGKALDTFLKQYEPKEPQA